MISKVTNKPLSAFWDTKKGKYFTNKIAVALAHSAIQAGEIDPEGKTDQQLRDEVMSFLRTVVYSKKEIRMIADLRSTLLREARRYQASNSEQLSVIMYATWFEHWINNVVSTMAKRGGHSDQSATQMICDTSIRAKFTWLVSLLGLSPIKKQYADIIFSLAEHRNAYVHYKWEARPEQLDRKREQEIQGLLGKVSAVVNYLHRYENKHLYRGLKHRVTKML